MKQVTVGIRRAERRVSAGNREAGYAVLVGIEVSWIALAIAVCATASSAPSDPYQERRDGYARTLSYP